MRVLNGGPAQSLDKVVLFPFDDFSIPFQHGVRLSLEGRIGGHGTKPVVPLGDSGAPDSAWIAFYGTVLRVEDEFWMWYLGQGSDEAWHQRVCLARSSDGRRWEKPNLGLVEYRGDKNNNLVAMGGDLHVQACVVFYDPDDPNPNQRFKMAFETRKYDSRLSVAYSADGKSWQESINNPVGGWFEMGGGARVDGCYYLAGQGGKHGVGIRQLVTTASYDFENWSEATTAGLRRSNLSPKPSVSGKNDGEQVHLGAALWNRGNVIIGLYGKWDGHPSNDRRMLTMDLGLAVSNDALHYKEPVPDFPMVSAAEDSWGEKRRDSLNLNFPALIQGQGFENIGDETLFWYAPWPEEASDGVRVTSWPRDRLSYFSPFDSGVWARSTVPPSHIVSAPIDLQGQSVEVSVNVLGLSEHSTIALEILDREFRAVAGYEREACDVLDGPGFKQPVTWKNVRLVENVADQIRIRVNFGGLRPEDVRLYAVYVEHV